MLGGSRKMVIYDDNNPTEKVKIYDKGVEIEDVEGIYSAKVQYRVGDMYAPALEETEALTVGDRALRPVRRRAASRP